MAKEEFTQHEMHNYDNQETIDMNSDMKDHDYHPNCHDDDNDGDGSKQHAKQLTIVKKKKKRHHANGRSKKNKTATGAVATKIDKEKGKTRKDVRIPTTLQSVFLASNRGNVVNQPPPGGVASKLFGLYTKSNQTNKTTNNNLFFWMRRRNSISYHATRTVDSSKDSSEEYKYDVNGDLSLSVSTKPENNDDVAQVSSSVRSSRSLTTSACSVAADLCTSSSMSKSMSDIIISPQNYLEKILLERGYDITRYKALQCGYASASKSPPPQKIASNGLKVIQCIQRNDPDQLMELLSQTGLSKNPCNDDGYSILHMICRQNNYLLFDVMVQKMQCNVLICDHYGRTPLHDTCWKSITSSSSSIYNNRCDPGLESNMIQGSDAIGDSSCDGNRCANHNAAEGADFNINYGHYDIFRIIDSLIRKDPYMAFVMDCRNCTPFEYIRQSDWKIFTQFLDCNKDTYWPYRCQHQPDNPTTLATTPIETNILHGSKEDDLPVIFKKPGQNNMIDWDDTLSCHIMRMVSNGKMSIHEMHQYKKHHQLSLSQHRKIEKEVDYSNEVDDDNDDDDEEEYESNNNSGDEYNYDYFDDSQCHNDLEYDDDDFDRFIEDEMTMVLQTLDHAATRTMVPLAWT